MVVLPQFREDKWHELIPEWLARILEKLNWHQQLERLPQPQDAHPDSGLLWHYTSLKAFEDITRQGIIKIRLNPLEQMNDSQEGKCLRSQLRRRGAWQSTRLVGYWPPLDQYSFAFSLSKEGDLLSQWRAYANGGRGVAIGFDPLALRNSLQAVTDWSQIFSGRGSDENRAIFCEVHYRQALQDRAIEEIEAIINETDQKLSSYSESLPPGGGARPWPQYAQAAIAIWTLVQRLEPMFKNPAFREEREWRAILYERGGSSFNPDWHKSANAGYHFADNAIKPFYEYEVKDAIRAVKIGPLCRATEDIMRSYTRSVSFGMLSITTSTATLQALS
jgi:hypothetical protein